MQTLPRLVATALAVASLAAAPTARGQSAEKPAPTGEKPDVRQFRVVRPEPMGVLVVPGDPADPAKPAPRTPIRARITVSGRPFAFPEVPATDPHRPVVERVRSVIRAECATCHAGGVAVQRDELLGLAVVPADETLRAQLGLKDRGLVVTAVAPGSSAEAGGVKEKDVILRVGDRDVSTVDDLKASLVLRAPGGPGPEEAKPAVPRPSPFAIALIRAGEPKEVRIESIRPTTLVVGQPRQVVGQPRQADGQQGKAPSYWIGVALDEADATLRSHLKLDDGLGLIVTDVITDGPAQKAGLKKNDILLAVGETPLKSPQDLIRIVQERRGKAPLAIRYRREGSEKTAEVRPEARKEPSVSSTRPGGVAPGMPWINELVPFLDGNDPGLATWRLVQPGTNNLGGPSINWAVPSPHTMIYQGEASKSIEGPIRAELERLRAEIMATKAAEKAASLGGVEAKLQAMDAQLREMKTAMDDLKRSLKKD